MPEVNEKLEELRKLISLNGASVPERVRECWHLLIDCIHFDVSHVPYGKNGKVKSSFRDTAVVTTSGIQRGT